MMLIGSYPDLTRAIADRLRGDAGAKREAKTYGVYYRNGTVVGSKSDRLAYAKSQGWTYDPPANFGTNVQVTEYEKKEQSYKPQTQATVEQLESGELKTDEAVYMVGGEPAVGLTTAQAVAEYKRQKEEARVKEANKEIMETVQADLRNRLIEDVAHKKLVAEKLAQNPYDVMGPFVGEEPEQVDPNKLHYTPPRTKSAQESIDVTTRPDYGERINATVPETMNKPREEESSPLAMSQTYEKLRSKSPWVVGEGYSQYLELQEKEAYSAIKEKQEKRDEALARVYKVSASQESTSPTEFKTAVEDYKTTEADNAFTLKESAVMVGAPVFFGVNTGVVGTMNALLNPWQTVKGLYSAVTHPGETGKAIATEFFENPLKATAKTATEIYLFEVGTSAGIKLIKPKVVEVPIKAKSIKVHESVRKTKTGKVAKDTQINIETLEGAPVSRYVWEESTIKPRKTLSVQAERTSSTLSEGGFRVVESRGDVNAVLKLRGDKAKLEVKEYVETQKPTAMIDPANVRTGRTSTGARIYGETGTLATSRGAEVVSKSRAGYEYRQAPKIEGIYKDGEYLYIKQEGKLIKVPESTSYKVNILGSKAYRGEVIKGELVGEIQTSGKFVKRKYTKAPEIIKSKPKTAPEFEVTLNKKGDIIEVKDLKAYQTTESGKVLKLGRKPSRYNEADFMKVTSDRDILLLSQASKVKSVTQNPIIGVIEKAPKSKGVPGLFPKIDVRTKTEPRVQGGMSEASIYKEPVIETQKGKGKEREGIISKSKVYEKERERFITAPSLVFESTIGEKSIQEPTIDVKEDTAARQKPIVALDMEMVQGQGFGDLQKPMPTGGGGFRPTFPPSSFDSIEDGEEQGYNVYMYEEGKRVKANKEPLPKTEAERLGRDIADNSLSDSFRLSQARERVPSSRRSMLATGGFSSPSKFYQSQSKGRKGFTVEKRSHRLDSFGERQGIKASKLIAERKRSALGKKWRF